jgi:hypothetical protein
MILIDCDDDDCRELKARLEKIVSDVGLASFAQFCSGVRRLVDAERVA